jgi:hypothetical protein
MLVLGGPRWKDAGWILAALAPAVVALGLNNLAAYVLSASGRAGRLLVAMLVLLVLLVQGMVAGIFFGRMYLPSASAAEPALGPALGMAIAHTMVITLVWLGPYLLFSLRTANLAPRRVLAPLFPALRAAFVMGAAVWGLRSMLVLSPAIPPWLRLAILVVAGVLVYAALAWREVRWCAGELGVVRAESP